MSAMSWYRYRFVIFVLMFVASGVFPQERRPLSVNDIEELLKAGVSQRRVAEIVEERGVDFEATETTRGTLKKAGADAVVMQAVERASLEFSKRKLEEERARAEADRRKVEEEKKRVEEERRKVEEQQRKIEEARRKEEESKKAAEEARRKAEEERKIEEARKAEELRRREEEERRKLEEARKREEDARRARDVEKKPLGSEKAASFAPAPPCAVDLNLVLQLDDGRRAGWRITGREGELCVVTFGVRYYYDRDWVLVKVVETDGTVITAPRPRYPRIGEKWLPFPLEVGKEWEESYTATDRYGGVGNYRNFFSVVGHEEITVKAGTFKAFKIKIHQIQNAGHWGVYYLWYAPEIGYYIKRRLAPDESSHRDFWSGVPGYELISVSRGEKNP